VSTRAEYRRYAEECLQAMRVAVIPEVRAALAAMAQRWSELADRIEHGSQGPAVGQTEARPSPGRSIN
jgi:hypothetical protein